MPKVLKSTTLKKNLTHVMSFTSPKSKPTSKPKSKSGSHQMFQTQYFCIKRTKHNICESNVPNTIFSPCGRTRVVRAPFSRSGSLWAAAPSSRGIQGAGAPVAQRERWYDSARKAELYLEGLPLQKALAGVRNLK